MAGAARGVPDCEGAQPGLEPCRWKVLGSPKWKLRLIERAARRRDTSDMEREEGNEEVVSVGSEWT